MDGVYISRTRTDAWEPDDDVGGAAHMLFDHGTTKAGLWRARPAGTEPTAATGTEAGTGPAEVEVPARETVLVLEGSVRVTVDRRETHELHAGDMLSIPERSLVGWDPAPDCMVFWIYS